MQKTNESIRGKGLWKFNNSLLQDDNFKTKVVEIILKTLQELSQTNMSPHLIWEILKYELRKFCIKFSIERSKIKKSLKLKHEKAVQEYETNPTCSTVSSETYEDSKYWLENWHHEQIKGVIMRSKSEWYEKGEKSTKYFLNLEKRNSTKNTIRKLFVVNSQNEEIESENESIILDHAHAFYQNLFQRKRTKSLNSCSKFLDNINMPVISEAQRIFCEKEITLEQLTESLESMQSGKSPGNDGLTIEFYKAFWKELQIPLFNSFLYSKQVGELSSSQRQAIIKLLEKREKDKRYINNWRPISLLNVDTKIISKSVANKLKSILPSIISHDQTAYVKGRFIGESTRLISDILEITDALNIGGYMLTADIEKAFDSMDHVFLLAVLQKVGFGPYFIDWIKIFLTKNESCVLNGGVTSKYFELQRGARQGDPIAAYLFIIALEVFFTMVRSNEQIEGLQLFDYTFLLSAYADDTTFFVTNIESIRLIFEIFEHFSAFSGFNLNKSKCEVSGIGVKKGVKTALCNIKNVNLLNNSIKVLGVHYSYDTNVYQSKNFTAVIEKIEKVLNIWKSRSLTLLGKIVIFKTLGISKIVYISQMSSVPDRILAQLEIVHKEFIWGGKKSKIKHSTLISDYSCGGLRDVDIRSKIKALQLSWLKRLYDNNFHPWKIIPSRLFLSISSTIFYPNLVTDNMYAKENLPLFYKNIINYWSEVAKAPPITASSILSESVYNNNFIKIENKTVKYNFLGIKRLFVADLFEENGSLLCWERFKYQHKIPPNLYFKWLQLIDSIPENWKNIIKEDKGHSRIFCIFKPHINLKAKIFPIDKLTSQEFYKIFIDSISNPPTSQKYMLNLFNKDTLSWKDIYNLPRQVTIDTYTRVFQYKCLNNILYLNNSLYKMKLTNNPLCSYCQKEKETIPHLFYECNETKLLWQQIQSFFKNAIPIPPLTLQSAITGFFDVPKNDFVITNTILLSFKLTLYRHREAKSIQIATFLNDIRNRENTERSYSFDNAKKREFHSKKWERVFDLLV